MLIPGHSKNFKLSLIVLGLILLFCLAYFTPKKVEGPNAKSITQTEQYFIEETQTRVIAEMGFPTDGFTPDMFMSVFPNVISEDFNGAEVEGDPYKEPDESSFIKTTLTINGMATFLENVSRRAGLSIDTVQDVDSVIQFMIQGKETMYSQVDLSGEYVCLPKKNTGEPVTLECALGLKAEDGKYYGISTSVLDNMEYQNFQTGQRIRVTGSLVPVEVLSSANWHTYDIQGIIWATSFVRI